MEPRICHRFMYFRSLHSGSQTNRLRSLHWQPNAYVGRSVGGNFHRIKLLSNCGMEARDWNPAQVLQLLQYSCIISSRLGNWAVSNWENTSRSIRLRQNALENLQFTPGSLILHRHGIQVVNSVTQIFWHMWISFSMSTKDISLVARIEGKSVAIISKHSICFPHRYSLNENFSSNTKATQCWFWRSTKNYYDWTRYECNRDA